MTKTSNPFLALLLLAPFVACSAAGDSDPKSTGASTADTDPGTGAESGNSDPTPGTSNGEGPGSGVDDTGTPEGSGGNDEGNPGVPLCQHECATTEDCQVNGAGDLTCDNGQCRGSGGGCKADGECVAQFSGWTGITCTAGGGECAATNQICVDIGDGTGGCATPPSEFIECATIMMEDFQATNLDDNSEVTVCANTNAVCGEQGFCIVPCTEDSCTSPGAPVCLDSQVCGCDDDQQCVDAGTGNTCVSGACVTGCTSIDDCSEVANLFDGGAIVCK